MTLSIALHMFPIIPCMPMAIVIFLMKKGTNLHKRMGQIWCVLMFISAASSFGIQGATGTWNWLHGLSAYTMFGVVVGWAAIRSKNLRLHVFSMVSVFLGSIIALYFTIATPGRMLNVFFFGGNTIIMFPSNTWCKPICSSNLLF